MTIGEIDALVAELCPDDDTRRRLHEAFADAHDHGFQAGRAFAEGNARGDLDLQRHWHEDESGRSNASPLFHDTVKKVADLLAQGSGQALDRLWLREQARGIVAMLAHREGFGPLGPPERREG